MAGAFCGLGVMNRYVRQAIQEKQMTTTNQRVLVFPSMREDFKTIAIGINQNTAKAKINSPAKKRSIE